MKQKVIVIAGPTASGKSEMGVKLASALGGEVISADSVQVYRGADIGSAKITEREMAGIPHHLINIMGVNERFSAGEFARLANEKINEISARGHIPIIVGGTGLYISALLFPLSSGAPRDDALRNELYKINEEKGSEALYRLLEEIDPKTAREVFASQTDRIVRAIEIYKTTGKKKSELTKTTTPNYDYIMFVLNEDREILYERINARVDKMVDDGLMSEVIGLIKNHNLNEKSPLLFGIGYREIFDCINEKISVDEAVDLIKQHSRNYAKRQLTWFKKVPNVINVSRFDYDEILSLCKTFLKPNGE